MKFHPKFTDMFSQDELATIMAFEPITCFNEQDEVHVMIVSTDTVFAELYADCQTSNYAMIMCFQPEEARITRGEFLKLLKASRQKKPLRVVRA